MTQEAPKLRKTSNAYNIFILVLTILSLAIMVVMLLPVSDETMKLLSVYDNLICVIFLIDFSSTCAGSQKIRLLYQGTWLARPARLDPFVRAFNKYWQICWPLAPGAPEPAGAHHSPAPRREQKSPGERCPREPQPVRHFITILLTILVLTVASVLVLQFESQSPDANITGGGTPSGIRS